MQRNRTISISVLLILLALFLAACSPAQANAEADAAQQEAPAPTDVPTAEPTPEPEIEPEVEDLGEGISLLLRGLPENVNLDVRIDPGMRSNLPDTMQYDTPFSEIVRAEVQVDGATGVLETGVAELCFVTEMTTMNEKPVPFYWDTSKDPLQDGRALRVSSSQKDPLVICAMITASGLYGLIAR